MTDTIPYSGLTDNDIKILSKPFPDNVIGVKVNNFNKDKTKAMLILYLQHTDVYARIEEVDPAWSCSSGQPQFVGKTIAIPMKMTIKGVTRENVGEGEDYKSAYSDAIKRAAMLFGVGRYLYDSEGVWVPYDETKDKYRVWTIEDYKCLSKPRGKINGMEKGGSPISAMEAEQKNQSGPYTGTDGGKKFSTEDETFTIGQTKTKGKKFSEKILEKDFVMWVTERLANNYAKSHPQLKRFHQYARERGAYNL